MEKDIFDILTEYALNERLDSIIIHDDEYKKAQDRIEESINEFNKLNLPEEQRLIVDKLVSSYTASGCCYSKAAYQQGVKDCASLLKKLSLL